MIRRDLTVPSDPEAFVDAMASQLGLESKRLTLASLPGSVHWHLSKSGFRGALEVTWSPNEVAFWLSVHDNRQGEWIADAIAAFAQSDLHAQ